MTSVLKTAIEKYDPSAVFALFSGGSDSLATVHYVAKNTPTHLFRVAHINTGIGIEQTRDYVRETCQKYHWPLLEYRTTEDYRQLVIERGFPGPTELCTRKCMIA